MRNLLYHTIAAVIGISSAQSAMAQWPQFGGPTRSFRVPRPLANPSHVPTKRWQQTLGAGMAGVIVQDDVVFTSFLKPWNEESQKKPEHEREHREVIIALNADNGETIWRYEYEAGWIESQQAFGGRSRAPQATPAVCGEYLVTIGFTGRIHCLKKDSGKVVWQKDAVKDFAATPVQFGFAASPVPEGDRVFVLTGGKKGGLLCLDVETGEKIWNLKTNEASYATPVLWNRDDGRQVIVMTRNRVVAADPESGKQLWEYRLPSKGLTNVPTPMPVGESGLLISGQGIMGTRLLKVETRPTGFEVTEKWKSGSQFFYCNWVRRNDYLFGCEGSLLTTLDLQTGKTLGRFRGFNDANLLLLREWMLILDGDGQLSTFRLADREMRATGKFSVLDERCWVPPTPYENLLYCRGGDQLLCLDMTGGDSRAAVMLARVRKKILEFGQTSRTRKADAMQAIVAAFENDGAEAAWKKYNRLRDDNPDGLPYTMRVELSDMANAQQLHDFAKLIMRHAAEDFPNEAKRANQTASTATTRGENGLVYVELVIKNTGQLTIQAEVKGPAKHPFGYGLPLRPAQPRLEKWPVGTKLYRTIDGVRADVLLTVEADSAGRTIEIPGQQKQ